MEAWFEVVRRKTAWQYVSSDSEIWSLSTRGAPGHTPRLDTT